MFLNKKSIVLILAGIFLVLAAAYSTIRSIGGDEDVWDVISRYRKKDLFDIPGRWITHDGSTVSFSDYRGQNLIVSFVYLECSVSCPLVVQRLKMLDHPDEGLPPVHFIIVILEDLTANPSLLREYGRKYGIENSRWTLLSSDYETLDRLTESFGIYYQETGMANFNFLHSNRILFVDSSGKLRREIKDLSRFNDTKIKEWMKNNFNSSVL